MKLTLQATVALTKLVICESLNSNEAQTGTSLRDKLALHDIKFPAELHTIRSAADFRSTLARIAGEVVPGAGVALHLEMHGTPDDGLILAPSGEAISWPDFAELCRGINLRCANHLLVTLAACHGSNALRGFRDVKEAAPFCMLIAPNAETVVADVVRFFDFYCAMLTDDDIGSATKLLPSTFDWYYCEKLLAEAMMMYVRQATMGKARRQRAERILSRVKKRRKSQNLRDARLSIRSTIQFSRSQFDRFRTPFLMADLPTNEGRFTLSHSQLMALARKGR